MPLPPAPLSPAAFQPSGAAPGLEAYLFRAGQVQPLPGGLEEAQAYLEAPDAFVWLSVTQPTARVMNALQHLFGLHPLAVEDALHAHQRAKVETYHDFWFAVVHSASLDAAHNLQQHETAMFIGARYVITCQYQPIVTSEILTRWEMVPETWRHSSSSLVYVFLDSLVDGFGPLADEIEQELRTIRTWLASGKAVRRSVLRRIFALEELSDEVYAIAMTLRDILPPFVHAAEEAPVGGPAEAPYFRDVHDHATGIVDRLNAGQNLSRRAFDIYQSLAAQQQNAVARQLTVVATIFLPLTFLTGFFGQNFDFLVRHIGSERAFWGWGVGSYVVSLLAILVVIRLVARD